MIDLDKYLTEDSINVRSMGDNELLTLWKEQKKKNFKKMSGKLFAIFIDEIKKRNLASKL